MASKPRQISSEFPYHINAVCINHEWFRIPMDDVWQIFCDYLYLVKHAFNLEIHSFVLMSNHFHMIVRTPDANISEAMSYFMREVSREISRRSDRINQVFGRPYHACLITTPVYYLHAYKYVYRNPVEARICENAQDYKYSTLSGLLGLSQLYIPIFNDETLFSELDSSLEWLNTDYKKGHKEKIRSGLRKKIYEIARDRSTRNPHELEKDKS